jgi:phosphoribosyl-ATP pyrophosphohydrolase/phosphoribosyl-AMP cyclohydrolase
MSAIDIEKLDWSKEGGLIPAVVQDAATRQVLMLGYMSRDALAATLQTGLVTFYSRSKRRLWQKGETSGHTLTLVSIAPDCDSDALLVLVNPHGPTCHRGTTSCFDS